MSILTTTNYHRVTEIRVKDDVLYAPSRPGGVATRDIFLNGSGIASITIFPEDGSPLDLEIRANCAATEAA